MKDEARNWVCLNGHEFPEDFEPDRCPHDGTVLYREWVLRSAGEVALNLARERPLTLEEAAARFHS